MCYRGLGFKMRQKVLCQDELTDEQIFTACLLTARQYGEVVLPDASIRAESWYFSQKIIPVQGGYGAIFANPGER